MMGPQDGVDYALRAIAHLRDRGRTDVHAVFVGAGDAQPAMVDLARELGLDGMVEFTGLVSHDEVARYISTADVCLAPDPPGPFNDLSSMIKVVEYMAIGRPIVSFDLPESRITAAGAALYAPDADEAAFADHVATLLDDPALRAEMGRRGFERFRDELSWDRSTERLLAAYDAAVA
jgi:glycosyltransferase involved in cell wall biosynthesis